MDIFFFYFKFFFLNYVKYRAIYSEVLVITCEEYVRTLLYKYYDTKFEIRLKYFKFDLFL